MVTPTTSSLSTNHISDSESAVSVVNNEALNVIDIWWFLKVFLRNFTYNYVILRKKGNKHYVILTKLTCFFSVYASL